MHLARSAGTHSLKQLRARMLDGTSTFSARRGGFIAVLVIGLVNAVLMLAFTGSASLERGALLLVVAVALALIPLSPLPGALGYLVIFCAEALLTPSTNLGDLGIPTTVFGFLVGRFLTTRVAILLTALIPLMVIASGSPPSATASILLIISGPTLLSIMLRHTETSRSEEVTAATERLASQRAEIAREMHDLVAYSMSQTALRAQRAAADPAYSAAARREFAAIDATASDALHELRLILRALRAEEAGGTASADRPAAGLGTVVLEVDTAVRAIADDLAAAGYSVNYQCTGSGSLGRIQATTLSRVAREMGSNAMRHGTPESPITITLAHGATRVRLMMTNGIAPRKAKRLPSSGTGISGMQERLSMIGGSLSALEDNGTWMVSATVPLGQSTTAPEEKAS